VSTDSISAFHYSLFLVLLKFFFTAMSTISHSFPDLGAGSEGKVVRSFRRVRKILKDKAIPLQAWTGT
jgi:hypothetical protein